MSRSFHQRLVLRRLCEGAALLVGISACGPSLAVAEKQFDAFNIESSRAARAKFELDPSLVRVRPSSTRSYYASQAAYDRSAAAEPAFFAAHNARPDTAIIVARAIDVRDVRLRGCFFDVGGELAFDEQSCAQPGDLGLYRFGTKLIVARFVTRIVERRSYENPRCLPPGRPPSGGRDVAMPSPPDAFRPPGVVSMLGISATSDIEVRDVTIDTKSLDVICTGTYETLGYPP